MSYKHLSYGVILLLLVSFTNTMRGNEPVANKLTKKDVRKVQAIWDRQRAGEIISAELFFQVKIIGPRWAQPLKEAKVLKLISEFDPNKKEAFENFVEAVSTKDLYGTSSGNITKLVVDGNRIYEESPSIKHVRDGKYSIYSMQLGKKAQIDINKVGESGYAITSLRDFRIRPPGKVLKPFVDKKITTKHIKGDLYELSSSANKPTILSFQFSKKNGAIHQFKISSPKYTKYQISRHHELHQIKDKQIYFPMTSFEFSIDHKGELKRLSIRVVKMITFNEKISNDQFKISAQDGDVIVDGKKSRKKLRVYHSQATKNVIK